MSELLYPSTLNEWKDSLHEVGYDGVVGTVMPDSYIQEFLDLDDALREARVTELATTVARVALGDKLAQLRYERKKDENWGLHMDISGENAYGSGVAELSFWVNEQGAARWTLLDSGSRDQHKINGTFERVEMPVPPSVADNGLIFSPYYADEYARVDFHGVGMMAFAAGLQVDGSRTPAIHQVDSIESAQAPEPRVSVAIYGRRDS